MPPGLKKRQILSPRESWEMWMAFGSLLEVSRELLRQGVVNEATGEPPTKSAIQKSAYVWALENPEQARAELEKAWLNAGEILKEEDWKVIWARMCRLTYYQRPEKLKQYILQHNLMPYYNAL